MKFAIDTNAYSAFNRGDIRLKGWINRRHDILVPIIVIGELKSGFAIGSQVKSNEELLQSLLDEPNVELLNLSLATTKKLASLYLKLRNAGTPIGANDMWIASLCLEHNLPLLTTDTDFKYVKDLKLVNI